jgi:signal transduction histidine kinase
MQADGQERLVHLNAVLRAIRNVNQLIVRVKDPERLTQELCKVLTETRGYRTAWLMLQNRSGTFSAAGESRLGKALHAMYRAPGARLMDARLKRGALPQCCRKALGQSAVVFVDNPALDCGDCPLVGSSDHDYSMAVRLSHGERVFGVLLVSGASGAPKDAEEQELLREVAGDIAFALQSIETENERRQAQTKVEWLARLPDEDPFMVLRVGRDGTLLYANKSSASLLRLWQCSVGDRVPTDWLTWTTEAFETRSRKEVESAWENRVHSLMLVPIPDAGYVNMYVQDITARKRAEEDLRKYSERLEEVVEDRTRALREAQAELIRNERLATLGQLAGSVGHELRNPLGVITNAVYFLKTILSDADETVKGYLDMVSSEVMAAEKIISDLLDLSRNRPPDRDWAAVKDLITQVLEKQRPPQGVRMITTVPEDLPRVFVDARQMAQVLTNLIVNAYQAMPGGMDKPGSTRLIHGTLTLDASEKDNHVQVTVSDTGCGIPEENLGRIFDPLVTTKARGIGLGLTVSKKLAELNQVRIHVESEVGKGSKFSLLFPTTSGPNGEARGPAP